MIDKDLSSSLLALDIRASSFIVLTDVEHVYLNFAGQRPRPIERMSAAQAERHLAAGEFFAGSMAPKIQAAIDFLRGGGGRVLIGLPEGLPRLLRGEGGTTLVP